MCTVHADEDCVVSYGLSNSIDKDTPYPRTAGDVIRRTLMTVPAELVGITTYPVNNPRETAIFIGVSTALLVTDKRTTWFLQDKFEPAFDIRLPTLIRFPLFTAADGYIIYGLGGLYLGSLALGSKKGQAAALCSFKAIAYSVIFSQLILKTAFARKRPFNPLYGEEEVEEPYSRNQYDFFHFHPPYLGANADATSFPSFRFTMYFATARVLQRMYSNYLIPYAICALASLHNFDGHDHWTSDMVAGALIGIAIGTVVTDNFLWENSPESHGTLEKKQGHHFSFSFIPGFSRCSLAFTYHF